MADRPAYPFPVQPGEPPKHRRLRNRTLLGRQFAREIVTSQAYRDSIVRRIASDTLAPAVEVMLNHYAWGKPVEKIEITRPGEDLANLTTEELQDEAMAVHQELLELGQQEREIHAQGADADAQASAKLRDEDPKGGVH